MSWYRTGTVTVTNGSANVTLAGGDALANIFPDDGFIGPDGRTYAVLSIGGSGSFTLQSNYFGATAAGQTYQIIPVADYVQLREALEQINALITAYQDIAVKAGVGLFEAGNAAAPGVRGIGHTGTGLVWNSDESLSISVGGTIVGTFKGTACEYIGDQKITGNPQFPRLIIERAGIGNWSIGYDGTPGSNSFALRLNGGAPTMVATSSGGNIGIGTTAPQEKLHVVGGAWFRSLTSYLHLYNPSEIPTIGFANQSALRIEYNDTTEVARFTSNGSLGINVIPSVRLHVKSSSEMARFETTVARGGGNGFVGLGDPTGRKAYWGYGDVVDDLFLMQEMNRELIFGTNGTARWQVTRAGTLEPKADNAYGIGHPSFRVSEIRLVNAPIVTSDEREKDWIGEASPAAIAAALQIVDELGFYTWKEDGKREHFGPRAQCVWAICAEHGLVDPITKGKPGKTPLAFLCYDEWDELIEPVMGERIIKAKYKGRGAKRVEVEPERTERYDTGKTTVRRTKGDRFGVRPDQLNMFMTYALNVKRKEQAAVIESLDERLSKLEGKVNV